MMHVTERAILASLLLLLVLPFFLLLPAAWSAGIAPGFCLWPDGVLHVRTH